MMRNKKVAGARCLREFSKMFGAWSKTCVFEPIFAEVPEAEKHRFYM